MAQKDDKVPVPYLNELKNEIETNSEQWTLETIQQTQQKLSSLTSQLNSVRNSRLWINKISPDILYIIFTLTVYCPTSNLTALGISHVCRHWMKSSLRWPILWAIVDLDNPSQITDLMMKRSRNAPLTLVWRTPPGQLVFFDEAPSRWYFESHADIILPRLCSLNVFATFFNFISIYDVIKNVIKDAKLPLLQLQDLTIVLFRLLNGDSDRLVPPSLTHLIDNSRLQHIELWGPDLPWLDLPHNKLTYLTLKDPINPPTLPQLLDFLSYCPCLQSLDLALQDCDYYRVETVFAPITSSTSLRTIDLPRLTRVQLEAQGRSSYECIRQLALRTRTLGEIDFFRLVYNLKYLDPSDEPDEDSDSHDSDEDSTPFQILGAIPPAAYSHFSQYQYLIIGFGDEMNFLGIRAHTSVSDQHGSSDLPGHSFIVTCTGLDLPIVYTPIIELIYSMSQLRHLTLKFHSWRILTLPNLDTRRAFPNLRTLVLTNCNDEALKSLPSDLRVKRFILDSCTFSFTTLLEVVMSVHVEILELTRCYDVDSDTEPDGAEEIISTLRSWGVDVVWVPHDDEVDTSESEL